MQRPRRHLRRFTLPIDPWPRESLGERMSIGFVLIFLLLVPFCAAGALCVLVSAAVLHVYRSHDVGTGLRTLLDRHVLGGGAVPADARRRQVTRRT